MRKSLSIIIGIVLSVYSVSCIRSGNAIANTKEVDLGLSVKWAGWNVGATSPEEYGEYYAWGETEEKTVYDFNSYNCNAEIEEGLNISGTQYDVARKKWGDSWRMPTEAEFKELVEKCKWEWHQYKGVTGYKITGPNGNSIFMPAGGKIAYANKDIAECHYWSSSIKIMSGINKDALAVRLHCKKDYSAPNLSFDLRIYGLLVRPVK